MARVATHPDPEVRWAVAFALNRSQEPEATALLIELSADPDAEVRDWATFGLGTQRVDDSPELREALFARLTDEHRDTRCEALLGLARRGDERVVGPLQAELEADRVGELAVEAAAAIGAPELLPALEGLVDWWDVDTDLLNSALEACREEPR
jgi:HEAT repeat protein